MIPSYITKQDLMEAIRRIRRDGVPANRKARVYCLVKDGCHFPPKYAIAVAHHVRKGQFLPSYEFSGGAESNGFLSALGFDVIHCKCGGSIGSIGYCMPGKKPFRESQTIEKRQLSAARNASVLRVALVFPQVNRSALFGIVPRGDNAQMPVIPTLASFAGENVDFVLFPEGYINASDSKRINSLKKLAADLEARLLVGATDNNVDSTGRTWQVLLRVNPDRSHSRIYVKHSTECAVAFERPAWRPNSMLPTFDLAGVTAGTTICHDQYLGLLPRFLAKRGARIWINPSYDNVSEIKWSSILRLRAVENRMFSLCTLHCNKQKTTRTHPFAFSPDGNELKARKAGTSNSLPLSKCTESETIYIVDLDTGLLGGELEWDRVPRADDLPKARLQNPRNANAKMPIHVRQIDEHPAVLSRSGWVAVDATGCDVETVHGSVYVGIVPNDRILDAAACFGVIDRAKQADCQPIIWNVWDELPADSSRLATLMLGRAIECCAPIIISDRTRIHELVELSNNYKNPTRRKIQASGNAIVDLEYAKGLDSAFRMVSKHLVGTMKHVALDRYRTLL